MWVSCLVSALWALLPDPAGGKYKDGVKMKVKSFSALHVGEEEEQQNEKWRAWCVFGLLFAKVLRNVWLEFRSFAGWEGMGKGRTRLWGDGMAGGSSQAHSWMCDTAGGNYTRLLLWVFPRVRLIGDEPRAGFSTSSLGRTSDSEEQRGRDAVHIREASQINDGNMIEAENKSIIPQ